jgi:hypothetical protein
MTDAVQTRRRRRTAETPAAPAITAGGPLPHGMDAFLARIRDLERTKDYRIFGRLTRAQILRPAGAKVLDFRKTGPVLAMADDDLIVVVDVWQGMPAKLDDTDEFCRACLATCDVCAGTGKKLCEMFTCGGRGRVNAPGEQCPSEECLHGGLRGHIKPGCDMCHGTGIFVGTRECPACKGEGKARCGQCRGTGKRPTGIEGGDTNWRKPSCPECKGTKFNHREIPQDVDAFIIAGLGEMVAIGPIVSFVVESVGGTGEPPQVYEVDADANGQHLVILLERNAPGARMYMLGGVLRPRSG